MYIRGHTFSKNTTFEVKFSTETVKLWRHPLKAFPRFSTSIFHSTSTKSPAMIFIQETEKTWNDALVFDSSRIYWLNCYCWPRFQSMNSASYDDYKGIEAQNLEKCPNYTYSLGISGQTDNSELIFLRNFYFIRNSDQVKRFMSISKWRWPLMHIIWI